MGLHSGAVVWVGKLPPLQVVLVRARFRRAGLEVELVRIAGHSEESGAVRSWQLEKVMHHLLGGVVAIVCLVKCADVRARGLRVPPPLLNHRACQGLQILARSLVFGQILRQVLLASPLRKYRAHIGVRAPL